MHMLSLPQNLIAQTVGQTLSSQSSQGTSPPTTGAQSFLSALEQRWSEASPVGSSTATSRQNPLVKTLQRASGVASQLMPSSGSQNRSTSVDQASSPQSPQTWSEAVWAHRLQQASGYAGALNLSVSGAIPSLSVNA
jgi:hypothetical protein